VEEKRIPSLWLNIMFGLVAEMMGRRSLITLLRQAGLPQYIDNLPPLDDTPSITVEEYSELLANIYEIFGARGAQPVFWQGGRLGASELRHQRPAQFAVAGTALRLLPSTKRMQIILEKLVEQGEEGYGARHRLQETGDAFYLEITACPYCAEIGRRSQEQRRPVTRPVCVIPAAILDEMMEWVTGQKHLVEETDCIAQGAEACRFRISK
jgi:predicted hydrocarbon binding protein